jgi:hypothetical protein
MNPQDVPILKSQIAGMSPQESIEWFFKRIW